MGKFIDMTGWNMWEHGVPDSRLTVIRQAEDYIAPSGKRHAQWLCECSCEEHNRIIVVGGSLRNGNTLSCGCITKERCIDMTGWVMAEHGVPDSRLTVIEQVDDYISPKGVRKTQWLCKCSCQQCNTVVALGQDIRRGKVKSCGCIVIKYNKYKLNLYDEYGLYGIGYCLNTNNKFYFDMDDYDKIKNYAWYESTSNTTYHIVRTYDMQNKLEIKMHQLLVGKYCDHADRNALNNRKYNLRIATFQENARNRSKYKNNKSGFTGVVWNQRHKKWESTIGVDYKKIYLGKFKNKQDAIRTRLEAEAKYFGEFAPQRHLFEEYGITIQNELEVTDAKEMDSET